MGEPDFAGSWVLAGAVAYRPEVEYVGGATDEDEPESVLAGSRLPLSEMVDRWLAAEVFEEEPPLAEVTGLRLEVAADGTFRESGSAPVEWYADDGAWDESATPFDGRIVTTSVGSFVLLQEPMPWWQPPYVEDEQVPHRMEEGDVRLTEALVRTGADRLRRTVSVVVDEMYPSRYVYEYVRG